MSNNISNTVIPLPPKTCNYTDLKDYLSFARKVNEKIVHVVYLLTDWFKYDLDHFAYEVNKIREPESECSKVWTQLENASNHRKQLINNCIIETEKHLNNQNNNPITNTVLKRQLEQRLNMLRLEEDVENVMTDAAQKIFHKVCKDDSYSI
ncbi:hypothetical protein DFA_04862 [Cavenderia fasciculata]|uniref:Coiled-coil domain-containing protein 58 n=1 Tax=Cavenderia fasciculata TaxID=261658 RepID=F4PM29_CACFS|nr:uncharacterized protein DFA_04862 [Cavenderia fasciculata]EGG22732.1 hypothetical protein DFA_04862 [Cavenderia fasciculata]|eukprot:XP_004360583.1 hypothetical protein DFA_04862 [Cavenderia fasciculata]